MLGHYARYLWYLMGGARTRPQFQLDKEWWESDYRRGGLARTEGEVELPRHLLVAALVRHYAPGGHVLDVGCGTGALTGPLRECFAGRTMRYVGLDFSEWALQLAAARADDGVGASRTGTVEFIQANFDEFRPQGSFDAIIFSESLYYAPDPARTVRRYLDVLADGGIVVISMWRRPSRARVWRAIREELREATRSRLVIRRRPAWDIAVYMRA